MITGNDLIEAGWQPGPKFPELFAAARALEAKGITDPAYILKLLERDFEKEDPMLYMRDEPLVHSEAIEATCELDESNIDSVRRFMRQLLRTPVIEAGAIMPDACPAGAGEAVIPVGGAISVKNAIIPAAHSADICCSMYASVFECNESTAKMLDALTDSTRFGFGGRKGEDRVHHPVLDESVWSNKFLNGLEEHAAMHIADQGDGNHFAYIGKMRITRQFIEALSKAGHDDIARQLHDRAGDRLDDTDGVTFYTLVTHHGSRGLGAHLYKRGHKAAIRETDRIAKGIPKAAAWLDTETPIGQEYWEALQYVGRWTKANHQAIHSRFLERAEADRITEFGNEHNFVWQRGDNFLHGKGATPAWKDEEGRPLLGLIPLNMAAPILVTLGRDNEEFLSFAPHGAGRNQSRTATMRQFRKTNGDIDEKSVAKAIQAATEGLDIRWYYGKGDLSESPVGYKPAAQVKAQIEQFDLADVAAEVTPLGCIMAGDPGPRPWEKKDHLTPKQKRQIEHRADRRKYRQKMQHWEDMMED
ncbi:MAG: RNA-splicing ligase RtcB [Verrucomicrobiales bacterium]|nr:RNA-splicing ligase RtcB [Verrucomicrobiales bacterium]